MAQLHIRAKNSVVSMQLLPATLSTLPTTSILRA
ncbi:hypothetical protein CXB51_035544 [Gossypium anomalum]|uniref:Uncharacterized protein n=1 Tax=Gossypium anomalum TaxID=47600 RepID=A0A8J6CKL5_9ROSI|nr:hypothetical protein CXB51_035544 [Gossypium anomalum]